MSIDRIFFGYMTLVGVVTGATLVAMPAAGDGWLKPYFWVLIAVGLFDVTILLLQQSRPVTPTLGMDARLLGFVLGIVLMIVIPKLAGSDARLY